jgi:DNA-binding transcriptional ArsR family regulator
MQKFCMPMDIFTALADSTRRNIIEMLARNGQLSATEIYDNFHVSPQAISQHLKVLREANLVRVEKRAQQRIYQMNPDAMAEVEDWAKQYRQIWSRRFEEMDKVLKAQSELTLKNKMEGNEETHDKK